MAVMNDQGSVPVATVIGDVVSSRAAPDRAALHDRLTSLLAEANGTLQPVVPLRVTVGDEYQGCFRTLGEALHATLWLRLHLAPTGVRHGLGWGRVAVLEDTPRVEDGPGWWAAREAIEAVKRDAHRSGSRLLRTAYHRTESGAADAGPDPDPVNAALICRDQMVGSVSERSLRLLRGALAGRTQAELAEEEGISASAVSQRMRNDGLAVIVAADELLRRVS
ncbi:MAG: SatD family protein [Marmoricola sp.]